MPTWTTMSLFLLAVLGLLFIPGPAVLFVMTRSVDQGAGGQHSEMIQIHKTFGLISPYAACGLKRDNHGLFISLCDRVVRFLKIKNRSSKTRNKSPYLSIFVHIFKTYFNPLWYNLVY